MIVEFRNATVGDVTTENIKFRNEEWHRKMTVILNVNTSNGVETHGVEVWDESIPKLDLKKGDTADVACRLIGRIYGGRWQYNLQAFRAIVQTRLDMQAAAPQPSDQPVDPF